MSLVLAGDLYIPVPTDFYDGPDGVPHVGIQPYIGYARAETQ
jgi:hypothetical protein